MDKELQSAITEFSYPLIPSSGKANSVEDFFDLLIAPQFKNKEAIKALHSSLMKYVNLPAPRFFVRSFGSSKSPEYYGELRRGFATEFSDKTRYTFCDNTFALIFANIKLSGHVPSEQQLYSYFDQELVKCGFKSTKEEAELAFYKANGAIYSKLNAEKWYLAHIHSVGAGYADFFFTEKRDEYFPRGERGEWDRTTKIRYVPKVPSNEQLTLLRAHFIRLTHPLNNFLVPNRNSVQFDRGHLIGEDFELIQYAKNFLKAKFKDEYDEMEKVIMAEPLKSQLPRMENIYWDKDAGVKANRNLSEETVNVKRLLNKSRTTKGQTPPSMHVDGLENSKINSLLNKIGKEAYVYIFKALKEEGIEISPSEIRAYLPTHIDTTKKQVLSTRVSNAKTIFRASKEKEALELVLQSRNVWAIAQKRTNEEDIRRLAEKMYDDYYEGDNEGS